MSNEMNLKAIHSGAFKSKRLERLKIHNTRVETLEG